MYEVTRFNELNQFEDSTTYMAQHSDKSVSGGTFTEEESSRNLHRLPTRLAGVRNLVRQIWAQIHTWTALTLTDKQPLSNSMFTSEDLMSRTSIPNLSSKLVIERL